MNNPVAAGGVGVVEQTQTRDQIALVMLINGSEEQWQEAVEYISGRLRYANASDLEACQQHCQSLEQRVLDCVAQIERDTQYLTAAQAEADRLRSEREIESRQIDDMLTAIAAGDRFRNQYRWLCDNLAMVAALMGRDQYATPQRCVEALMPLDDTAIHAAKTEQENE